MTKAQLRSKPKKTLVLLATLRRVYKGGKKEAEKKSKDALVNALFWGKKNIHYDPIKKSIKKAAPRKTTKKVSGARKFGIDVRTAKDITDINKKIKEKLLKAGSYRTIEKALAESRYLYVLSFTPAWKKDLKSKLMSVRRRAKSNYCSLVPVANKRLKEKGIIHTVFTKICKR